MSRLPSRGEVEERLVQLLVRQGNTPIRRREAFRAVALELRLTDRQLTQAVWVYGRGKRNAWQYLCKTIWADWRKNGRLVKQKSYKWRLTETICGSEYDLDITINLDRAANL